MATFDLNEKPKREEHRQQSIALFSQHHRPGALHDPGFTRVLGSTKTLQVSDESEREHGTFRFLLFPFVILGAPMHQHERVSINSM
jgi:hypothetical protein